ncbi:class F sortase [Streptomyces violaceorubidus]
MSEQDARATAPDTAPTTAPSVAPGGRLVTGIAWAVLLLGLWLCGREATDVREGISRPRPPATWRRPAGPPTSPCRRPTHRSATPGRSGWTSPDSASTPPSWPAAWARAAIEPPPFDQPGAVGWYAAGVTPGAVGTALMVGHVDTETRPAVFYELSTLEPGETIRVVRDDAEVAEFTVDDVQVLTRDGFDAQQAYGPRDSERAELRLITCGGTFDRATADYTANVVVSAYLTGTAS